MKETWIEWKGGNCPVDTSKEVRVKLRNEYTEIHFASEFRWQAVGSGYDIVAFSFIDGADDNWINCEYFKSCPVEPDTQIVIKTWDGDTAIRRAGDLQFWGDGKAGVIQFRIIPEPKEETGDWIEWHGGECPVDKDTLVVMKFRGKPNVSSEVGSAGRHYWLHDGHNADIIAYKIVKEEPKMPPKEITIKSSKPVDLLWGSW